MQRRSGGLAAVLFTDIVNSTAVAAEMGNARWSELVARHHRIVRRQLGRSGGREIDTAGDGFFVIFDRPADAIRCAVASAGAVRELGVEIRAGVSFGEMDTSGQKPSGLAVNTAARVMSMAGPGEVLVPVSVREIVSGTGIAFSENGTHHLRGLEGEFRLFRVTEVDGTAPAPPLDPEVAAERRREILPRGRRRTPLLVGVVLGVVALTAIGALVLSGGGTEPSGDAGPLRDAVARFDVDEGRVETSHFLGERGIDSGVNAADIDRLIAVGEGYVWLLQPPFLLQVDPRLEGVRDDQIFVGAAESQNVLTGLGKVWVLTGPVLFEVHPGTGETSVFFELPPELGLTTSSLALGQAVWVGTSGGTLFRLDPSTGEQRQMDTGSSIDALAATEDDVWLADVFAGTVTRVDPGSLEVVGDPIPIEGSIDQITASEEHVWVLNRQLGAVTRIDAETGDARSERVGDSPTDMVVTEDAVWVADLDGQLYEVDATTMLVTTHRVGAEVRGVGVDEADGSVWVYVGDPVTRPPTEGP